MFSFGDGACTDEMAKLAGAAAEGLICSQAGLPASAASKEFNDAFKAKYGDVKQYAPFFYDAVGLMIAAMQKADSTDPAKYLPELQKISYNGATGKIEFDEKGDRKNAEITIFTLKDGKVVPVGVVKAGKASSFEDFMKEMKASAAAANPAPAGRTGDGPGRGAEEVIALRTQHRRRRPSGAPLFFRASRAVHRSGAHRTLAAASQRLEPMGARRPQPPACGFPARLRSSTHDFAGRATRDGRRDLRAPDGTPTAALRGAKRDRGAGRAIRSRANLSPSAQCVRRAAGSRVLTARRAAKHAPDDTSGDS